MHKNQKKLISNIISKYNSQINLEGSNTEIYDNIRNKFMIEIRAAQVFAHIEKNDSTKVSFLIKSLIENSRTYFPNGWDEKPYGLDDMDHGSYGSITSAICALALIKALKLELEKNQQEQIIEKLNKVFDTFYFFENNGHIVKNLINKSKVFNTDLLVALAIAKYLEILPKASVRKKLFKEICLRCINKTISSQLPNGAFRYHELSIGVPFLYQAMCTSLLFTLSNYISHPYIYKSAYKGSLYLLKNYDANNWHTYGWEWTDEYARWWVNGKLVNILYKSEARRPELWPDGDMYIILNNGVRTAAPTSGTTIWPNQLEIDYIELYQKN